jgi:hypothetical protein
LHFILYIYCHLMQHMCYWQCHLLRQRNVCFVSSQGLMLWLMSCLKTWVVEALRSC